MNAVPFDTLALARRLEQAGFSVDQAQGTAAAFADALGGSQLVTRDYLDERFREFEQRMDQKLLLLEQRMTIRLGVMLAAAVAIMAGIQKL